MKKKVFIVAWHRMMLGDSYIEVYTDINKALQDFLKERNWVQDYINRDNSVDIFVDYLEHTSESVEGELYYDSMSEYTRVVISTHEI
jgi:hypothetical protein